MGVDSRRPPLPAPTDTDSVISGIGPVTDLATDVSRATEKSSYSLPSDGTPVTIATKRRGDVGISRDNNKSQTSLLIEYFEGPKDSKVNRRPSVRVKVTPSSKRNGRREEEGGHIQITKSRSNTEEAKSGRKSSYSKRINLSSSHNKGERVVDLEDGASMSSYASATEESNVSRNPIEVEIRPGRHGSPLIPDERAPVRDVALGSDVSSMPANSFLDGKSGSGLTDPLMPQNETSRGLSKGEMLAAGAVTGLAAAAAADKLRAPSRRRSRSLSRERVVAQKVAEKVRDKSERRPRTRESRSRSVSNNEKQTETVKSPRRRTSRGVAVEESLLSPDSSQVTSSRVSDGKSYRSSTSKASSINNPKLLETVEDAIRRLILPELDALKKENASRDKYERERRERRGSFSTSSGVSRESREEGTSRKTHRSTSGELKERHRDVSGGTVKLTKKRDSDRDRLGSDSPRTPTPRTQRSVERGVSEETVSRGSPRGDKRSGDKRSTFGALAAGIGLGGLVGGALAHSHSKESIEDRERSERRRRRTKSRSRSASLAEDYEDIRREEITPPMPLMSDINASEMTRSSILSANTDRPRSASGEQALTPVQTVAHGVAVTSPSHTPTRSPFVASRELGSLGTYHNNTSHGDLNRENAAEYEINEAGQKIPMKKSAEEVQEEVSHDEKDQGHGHRHGHPVIAGLAGAATGAMLGAGAIHHYGSHPDDDEEEASYSYDQQHVPSPLRYTPYNAEKRGLSPIQSVSGYTEDESLERKQQQRDSQLTRSTGSYSTLDRSSQRHEPASFHSDRTNPSYHDFQTVRQGGLNDSELTNEQDQEDWEREYTDQNRDLDNEGYRNSDGRLDYKQYDDGDNHDRVAAGQSVRGIGANPDYVHTPVAVESAVASLLDASVLTGDSLWSPLDRQASYASYDEGSERHFSTSRGNSPTKYRSQDMDGGYDSAGDQERDIASQESSPTKYPEYQLDDHGRKITMPDYKSKTTTGKAALAGIVGGAATAIIANRFQEPESSQTQYYDQSEIPGAPLQKSFKDRAKDMVPPSPSHSLDRHDDDEEQVKMTASGIPDAHDQMPEIGHWKEDNSDVVTNPSPIHGAQHGEYHKDEWDRQVTPTQESVKNAGLSPQQSDSGFKAAQAGLLGATAGFGAGTLISHQHKYSGSNHNEEDWPRTSEDRKRDTLITNPYEGSSPVTLLGGQHDRNLLEQLGYDGVKQNPVGKLGYSTGSPGALPKDEGYISSAPNALSAGGMTPEPRLKGVGFTDNAGMVTGQNANADPFYTPKHARQVSGMSHGYESPLYDGATGAGMDNIESKDIVALMQHLTVRDAQRNARDTEILITLVRAATEMRNSFEDMKRLLADTEDVVITEVQRNTDRSVQKAINGPRPLPQSTASRSLRSGTATIEDLPAKKKNLLRGALKKFSIRSNVNDLARIEDMLVQLLGDVEGLKVGQGMSARSLDREDYDMDQDGAYEQDGGYEPEGHAGTSTASHASQSGHFSNPLSRGTSATTGFNGRKFSENRISTVPEGDEEDIDPHEQVVLNNQFENNQHLLTPVSEPVRGSSAPLDSPPQQYVAPASMSNENTPKTDKSKKHKSSNSFGGWNPVSKISRWSNTTASTVAQKFRASGRRDTTETFDPMPSRSGSDIGNYDNNDNMPTDPYGSDKLHSGFSQDHIPDDEYESNNVGLTSLLPPEDPKYKAHRNSLNLQHPQPRAGPTHRVQTALESRAQDFAGRLSPQSEQWGSQISLNRLPVGNPNRYSAGTTGTDGSNMDVNNTGMYSLGALAPARPPKEPINQGPEVPPKVRLNKLVKASPLSNEHLPGGDGSGCEYEGSPRVQHRTLSGLQGVPMRRPTGPRVMGSKGSPASGSPGNLSPGGNSGEMDRRNRGE